MRKNVIFVAVLVLAGAPLSAQRNDGGDVNQNDCRLAAQIVRTGHPAPHREWAYCIIAQCADSGPGVIAAAWQDPPADEQALQLLVRATSQFRTRRVFEAVGTAARNPQNSTLVRTYAFSMLYGFAWPGSSLRVADLLQPRGQRPARVYQVSGDRGGGNEQDLGDVKTEVRDLLSQIIATEPDPVVVRTARAVRERI